MSDGRCVLAWRDTRGALSVYPSLSDITRIHGHEGRTEVVFLDAKKRTGLLLPDPVREAVERAMCGQATESDRRVIQEYLHPSGPLGGEAGAWSG